MFVRGTRLDYASIFRHEATYEIMMEKLDAYAVEDVLDYLGRISAILYNDDPFDPNTQFYLCKAMFGDDADYVWAQLWQIAQLNHAMGDLGPIALFDIATVALTTKFALLQNSHSEPFKAKGRVELGEAMLIANSFVDAEAPSAQLAGSDGWCYHEYVVSLLAHRNAFKYELARAWDLFLQDRAALINNTNFVSFRSLVENGTNLTPEMLTAALFAVVTHFFSIHKTTAHNTHPHISRKEYFSDFDFSTDQAEYALRILGQSLPEAIANIGATTSKEAIRPYDHSVLARYPLLYTADRAYCPVLNFLTKRISTGLYHTLLNAAPQGKRAKVHDFIGEVFEDYVDCMLRRVMTGRFTLGAQVPLYLGPQQLGSISKGRSKMCDHLIFIDGDLILWESKAKFLPLNAQTGHDQQTFFNRLTQIVGGAAEQIEGCLMAIENGSLSNVGLESDRIQRIFPAVVSLAEYPMTPSLFAWIQALLKTKGCLQSTKCFPTELILISELEHVESEWTRGASLSQLLAAKSQLQNARAGSLKNFIARKGHPDFQGASNEFLDSVYTTRMEEVDAFWKARYRGSEPWPSDAETRKA